MDAGRLDGVAARTLVVLHGLVTENPDTQLVIATHSPILLGYPDATILSFDGTAIAPISWDETSSVQVTRSFLADRSFWFERLFRPPDPE